MAIAQPEQPVKARAALAFLLSERGNFFREFILDEVSSYVTAADNYLWARSCT
jgi:aarF domain-containing kinase